MKRPKQKSLTELEAICIVWNDRYPIGSEVKFHPVIGRDAHRVCKTKSNAYVLSGHTPVISLEGVPGCVALEACEVV